MLVSAVLSGNHAEELMTKVTKTGDDVIKATEKAVNEAKRYTIDGTFSAIRRLQPADSSYVALWKRQQNDRHCDVNFQASIILNWLQIISTAARFFNSRFAALCLRVDVYCVTFPAQRSGPAPVFIRQLKLHADPLLKVAREGHTWRLWLGRRQNNETKPQPCAWRQSPGQPTPKQPSLDPTPPEQQPSSPLTDSLVPNLQRFGTQVRIEFQLTPLLIT